jgi:DNA-binding CsgD family transcriptional regulator
VVPTWPLVGRDAELHFVLEAVRGADSTGVVVAGAMGVGKTRLAREAAAALRTDFAIEWTAATPASASIPFGPLAHLLPALDVSSPDDRLRLLRGITATLTERAGGAPLVLVVDDAQWFDAGAAALVHQLVVSRAGRVLLTVRTGEQAADPIVSLWKDGLVERLELQPLSALELDTLVVSVLDRPVDRSTLGRFWALSRGNPLFVRELLLAALEADAFSERDGVWSWTGGFGSSTRLSAILEIRLGHVSPKGRAVLDHLALGEPLPLDTLVALCGIEGVAEVERVGLVVVDSGAAGEARLSHPLYGEALRAALTTVERRLATARLADAMEHAVKTSRAHLLRVAGWRLDSCSPAAEWVFTEAAELANAAYDHAFAERLARRAVAEGGGLRASLALGEALNRQGRCVEGLAVLEPLADHATSDREHVAVAIARYFGRTTEYGFRLEFEPVLADAERHVRDPQLRAFLRAQRAGLLCFAGRLDEGIALASHIGDGPPDETSELRAVPALAGAWLCAGKPESACALAARMLEPALRHRDQLPQGPSWVMSTQLPALVASGRLDEADAAVAFVEAATASRAASAEGASFVALARGMSALHRGQARTAHRWLRESVAGMRPIARWRLPFPLAQLVEACALMGDADGATAASVEADELVAHAAIFEGLARRARGWAAVARGQRSTAVELFLDAANWSDAHGQHTAELFALHDAVRVGRARQAAASLLALAPHIEGRWAPCFAAHAAALTDDDAPGLEETALQFEEMGAVLLAAEATAEASAAFRIARVHSRAERCAARARLLASACEGARTPILDDLEQPLPLTTREREVVRLAAEGLSSSAIAERLFVSTRTVDGHLHRAYTKLGVGDRPSLTRLLKATTTRQT